MSRWAQEDVRARDAYRKQLEKEAKEADPSSKKKKKAEDELMAEIKRMREKRALDKKHADRIRTSIRR